MSNPHGYGPPGGAPPPGGTPTGQPAAAPAQGQMGSAPHAQGPGPQGQMGGAPYAQGQMGPGPQGQMGGAPYAQGQMGPGPQGQMGGAPYAQGPGPQGQMGPGPQGQMGPGPQGQMGYPPQGQPAGWGVPQQPMPPPHLQQAPFPGMAQQPGLLQPPADAMPAWARIIARVSLGIGLLLVVATIIGGISSESLGVSLAMLAGAPLGFGAVATALTQKHARGGPGKPIGIGCLVGFALSAFVFVFFAAIWPSL